MNLLIDGIKVGLIICFMLGPLFFALLQASLEKGFVAGVTLGFGIWSSDLVYIVISFLGMGYLEQLMANARLTMTIGIIGGSLLMIFGAVAIWSKPNLRMLLSQQPVRDTPLIQLWLKGFFLNIFNPFTIFLWLGLMTTVLSQRNLEEGQAMVFFGGVIGTVASTDILKALLAKKIRRVMKPRHILLLRRIAGFALVVFGVALIVRSAFA